MLFAEIRKIRRLGPWATGEKVRLAEHGGVGADLVLHPLIHTLTVIQGATIRSAQSSSSSAQVISPGMLRGSTEKGPLWGKADAAVNARNAAWVRWGVIKSDPK